MLVNKSKMKFHEINNIFPMVGLKEFEGLKSDIKAQGLLESILIYEDTNVHILCLSVQKQRFE